MFAGERTISQLSAQHVPWDSVGWQEQGGTPRGVGGPEAPLCCLHFRVGETPFVSKEQRENRR